MLQGSVPRSASATERSAGTRVCGLCGLRGLRRARGTCRTLGRREICGVAGRCVGGGGHVCTACVVCANAAQSCADAAAGGPDVPERHILDALVDLAFLRRAGPDVIRRQRQQARQQQPERAGRAGRAATPRGVRRARRGVRRARRRYKVRRHGEVRWLCHGSTIMVRCQPASAWPSRQHKEPSILLFTRTPTRLGRPPPAARRGGGARFDGAARVPHAVQGPVALRAPRDGDLHEACTSDTRASGHAEQKHRLYERAQAGCVCMCVCVHARARSVGVGGGAARPSAAASRHGPAHV